MTKLDVISSPTPIAHAAIMMQLHSRHATGQLLFYFLVGSLLLQQKDVTPDVGSLGSARVRLPSLDSPGDMPCIAQAQGAETGRPSGLSAGSTKGTV